jgi:hypothetical protein
MRAEPSEAGLKVRCGVANELNRDDESTWIKRQQDAHSVTPNSLLGARNQTRAFAQS